MIRRILTFRLPAPPSVNALYINRKHGTGYGRIKSPAYRAWITQADKQYLVQGLGRHRMSGRYRVEIAVPEGRKDIDGYAKAILDWMVSRQITDDDKFLAKLTIEIDPELEKECQVTVEEAA